LKCRNSILTARSGMTTPARHAGPVWSYLSGDIRLSTKSISGALGRFASE